MRENFTVKDGEDKKHTHDRSRDKTAGRPTAKSLPPR